jgi:hypothetical protein
MPFARRDEPLTLHGGPIQMVANADVLWRRILRFLAGAKEKKKEEKP